MAREALGEFEHQVLLATLRLGQESYSVPVVEELEVRTRKDVAPAAVYIALRRLEKKGLLTSRLAEADPIAGTRERRYFKLTDLALERLRDSRRAFLELWDGLDPLLERG